MHTVLKWEMEKYKKRKGKGDLLSGFNSSHKQQKLQSQGTVEVSLENFELVFLSVYTRIKPFQLGCGLIILVYMMGCLRSQGNILIKTVWLILL